MPIVPDPLAELLTREKLLIGLRAILLLLAALTLVPMLRRTVRTLAAHRLAAHQQMLLTRAVSWLGYGLATSCVLSTLGFDLGVLVGAAGVFTVGLSFASQTAVSQLISGIFLLIEQPFEVGDLITHGGITGEILSVDLLSVKVRTPDKQFVRLPNQSLLQGVVVNLTRFDIAGNTLEFSLALGQDLGQVAGLLAQLAAETPAVLDSPGPVAQCTGYTDLGVSFSLAVWTPRAQAVATKTYLYVEGLRRLAAAGLALPAPRRQIGQADRALA